MKTFAAAFIGVLVAAYALTNLTSCSSGPCGTCPAPFYQTRLDPAHTAIRWTAFGASYERTSATVRNNFTAVSSINGECYAWLPSGTAWSDSDPTGIDLLCLDANGGFISFKGSTGSDWRDLGVGTMVALGGDVGTGGDYCCDCKLYLEEGSSWLAIEEVQGGAADNPTTVSPDYRRAATLYVSATVAEAERTEGNCDGVSLEATIRLVQTADDYWFDENARCECE